MADCPLAWLRRRKDQSGKHLITQAQFDAGVRLREDFHKGRMTPSVTTNWSSASLGGTRAQGYRDDELTLQDRALAARERVRRALDEAGPELSGILVDVCCHELKIAQAEHAAGLPQRSGKVVLGLALNALARHYGLTGPQARAKERRAGATRHWGSNDFQPSIDGGIQDGSIETPS